MGYILETIIAMARDCSIGEEIPDLDGISEKDLKKAGIDVNTKKELMDSQGKCKQILNAIYSKISSIKVSGMKDKLRSKENSQKYGPADKTNPMVVQAEKINKIEEERRAGKSKED